MEKKECLAKRIRGSLRMARTIPRHEEEENDDHDDDYEMPKNLPPKKMKGSLKMGGRAPNHDDDEML
jgi:hypothetical protein